MQWNRFALSVFASTAATGAYDMSLKSLFLQLLLCTSALCWTVPVEHTRPYPIAGDAAAVGFRYNYCLARTTGFSLGDPHSSHQAHVALAMAPPKAL